MGKKDQICDYCKDLIHSIKEDAYCIQKGYFNIHKEFMPTIASEVLHGRCYELMKARAIVMADIAEKGLFGKEKEDE